jgi:phosphopantothenoylcysteine decarboxylase/phosphopantothenate--cysteine ligase
MKKHVLIGVCGGIAAYKTLEIISLLKKQDIDVTVVMTAGACEFVTPLTFQTVSQNKVYTEMFQTADTWEVEHIELSK